MSSDNESRTYITEKEGTAYVVSSKGNVRNNEKIGRLICISQEDAIYFFKKKLKGEKIDKEGIFRKTPYNKIGGRIVYEPFDRGGATLTSKVKEIKPSFDEEEIDFLEIVLEDN